MIVDSSESCLSLKNHFLIKKWAFFIVVVLKHVRTEYNLIIYISGYSHQYKQKSLKDPSTKLKKLTISKYKTANVHMNNRLGNLINVQ